MRNGTQIRGKGVSTRMKQSDAFCHTDARGRRVYEARDERIELGIRQQKKREQERALRVVQLRNEVQRLELAFKYADNDEGVLNELLEAHKQYKAALCTR